MPDLNNWGQFGVLREDVEYGVHIALTCKNHPNLRWSTKNIAPIGARSVFYQGAKGEDFPRTPECACSLSDLVVLKEGG